MSERVFILGGSAGMGLACARLLLTHDYQVTIAGRNPERLRLAQQTLGAGAACLCVNAADAKGLADALQRQGGVDHLLLAFGSNQGGGAFAEVSMASVIKGFEEKVFPQLACAQAARPWIRPGGSLTFISAVSAHASLPGTAGLASANAAISALVPVLAREWKPVRVNGIAPGVVDTDWWNFLPSQDKQRLFADYAAQSPAGRVGRPEDIADAARFLIGNGFMTGQVLVCDGGLSLEA
ncbi:SDR family oxidoreductase [Chromobacterium sp. IIBBL 290-4]|uniref:SDR family oxidoreductase n=1 Tax=Chromobacterium sp. IIBBL 290-4 TaxID=2953890 RepID=UPI0020B8E9A2|nr:SDR family oxidoreductase [Chromobacterium sp. IIBBL 290-4]UTH73804.1 SDR family oxidoreductase [Chromobacterium sp. IIBBL 290-4]